MKQYNRKSQGYIIHEDRIRVIIALGFRKPSKNIKTGRMIQIFILRKDIDPVMANRTGKDSAICGNCPLRGHRGTNSNGELVHNLERECYVTIAQSPLSIWKAYKRSAYPVLDDLHIFNNSAVRFGAYGDPVFIPFPILSEIANRAQTWTGYTHQWRNPIYSSYRHFLMASVENEEGMSEANESGWRTFRVSSGNADNVAGEILCVNESKGVQCIKCGLCKGSAIKAKNIRITVHGTGKNYFKNN